MSTRLVLGEYRDGAWHHRCDCGESAILKTEKWFHQCSLEQHGPGTELKKIIADLELTGVKGCGCGQKASVMDAWGVGGCRANRDTIAKWIKKSLAKVSFGKRLAAYRKLRKADWFSHLDPYGSVVDEAIRRAG